MQHFFFLGGGGGYFDLYTAYDFCCKVVVVRIIKARFAAVGLACLPVVQCEKEC